MTTPPTPDYRAWKRGAETAIQVQEQCIQPDKLTLRLATNLRDACIACEALIAERDVLQKQASQLVGGVIECSREDQDLIERQTEELRKAEAERNQALARQTDAENLLAEALTTLTTMVNERTAVQAETTRQTDIMIDRHRSTQADLDQALARVTALEADLGVAASALKEIDFRGTGAWSVDTARAALAKIKETK